VRRVTRALFRFPAKLLALSFATFLTLTATAQTVTVRIDTGSSTNSEIPSDFLGLSFGMRALLPDQEGARFFSPSNTALIQLFQNLGLRHLRLGGTTVEAPPTTPIPDTSDIDNLFRFARTAGVRKIIYSLRLLETNATLNYASTNARLANYIWANYQPQLDCFAIGNEPDLGRVYNQDFAITNFETYLEKWRRFAAAITNAVPRASFAGPDAASAAVGWTTRFAAEQKSSGLIKMVTGHFYVGGKGRDVAPNRGIEAMLSPAWLEANERLYQKAVLPVLADGLAFRFTEANDHYSGGVPDASDTYAGALWALDFLHWWAAHGVIGVDFHNTQWVVNDVITRDPNGQPAINPKGYGFGAFKLGSPGRTESLSLGKPGDLNLTAYVVNNGNLHFLTVINKEHGSKARAAKINLPDLRVSHARLIRLKNATGDVSAKTGVTLGDAPINAHEPWQGKWSPLAIPTSGEITFNVPPASAAIVELQL